MMFRRQTSGSMLCPSCGQLVGVRDEQCLNCGRRNPGMWGFGGLARVLSLETRFVPMVLWTCGVLYVCALVVDPTSIRTGGMAFLAPGVESLFLFGASGAIPVFGFGRWWTVLSAAWLHGGLLHIAFNLLWLRDLGSATTQLFGGARAVLIFTASAITGFAASSFAGAYMAFLPGFLRGAGFTVGASAPIFGLLGALIHYGQRTGSSVIRDQAKRWALILFIFGFIFPGVDNWAHLGGFAGGYAAAHWLDPRKPERMNHVIAALVCLCLSAASILASVVTGLKYFR